MRIEAAQPLAEDAHSLRLLEPGLNLGIASCYAGTEALGGLRVWTSIMSITRISFEVSFSANQSVPVFGL